MLLSCPFEQLQLDICDKNFDSKTCIEKPFKSIFTSLNCCLLFHSI